MTSTFSTSDLAELRRAKTIRARALKAARDGYHPDDEVFYSSKLIRRILPYALDANATVPPTVADAGEVNRRHAGKADGYGGWEAAVVDVRRALETMPPLERRLLILAYRGGFALGWIASRLGREVDYVKDRLARAVHHIQWFLGGSNPYRETQ